MASATGSNMWRILLLLAVLTPLFTLQAKALDPAGEWQVEDGVANIRIALCDGRLWGIIAWEQKPGIDAENPDPALRSRPTLGLPIVLGMKPAKPDQWEGPIYNAKNGKTYQATITLKGPNEMEVEGCLWQGWLCGGQDWTRVQPPPVPPSPTAVGSSPEAELCLRLGVGAGRPHERGLKQERRGERRNERQR
jgi:uncharacterized protein (DUF2147 family)